MKSFARILRPAPPRCVISLHALGISRGSVWFGSGFHSVSINIQLLFVKGMYNPLKYIFGTSHSHLVLVQEYSWCHLGQDNGNLSQSCVFILLVPSLPHTQTGAVMNMLHFRVFRGLSGATNSNCTRRGSLLQPGRCHFKQAPQICREPWLPKAKQHEKPRGFASTRKISSTFWFNSRKRGISLLIIPLSLPTGLGN